MGCGGPTKTSSFRVDEWMYGWSAKGGGVEMGLLEGENPICEVR